MKTIIHAATNNLENSLDFYTRLGFQVVSKKTPTWVTDGKIVVEVNPDRFARSGLKIFSSSWAKEIKALKKMATVYDIDDGYMARDTNGVWMYLIEKDPDIKYEPSKNHFGITGNFSGLSIETTEMSKSITFWKLLGFTLRNGSPEQGWATCTNGQVDVNFMKPLCCPHLFFNPSMTFFNGKNNLDIIQKIREANIPISEEITHFNGNGITDNIIIRDPGGYGFFIFND